MQFYLKLSTQSPLEQKICPKEVKTPENRVFYEGYEQTPWKNISVFEAWVLENRSPILNNVYPERKQHCPLLIHEINILKNYMEENLSQFPMFQGLIDEVNEKIEGLHITQHYYLSVILRTQAIFSTTFPNTYLADNRFNREEFEILRFLKEKGGQSTYDQLAPLLVADIDTIDKIISSIDEFSSQRDLLPVALKKEIAKSIVTKLPSVYFFAVPDSGYFGYDFMAMAYIENFYPIAMPQKPLKAHGEEMSPQWFSFHDYGHLISDIEQKTKMCIEFAFKAAFDLKQQNPDITDKALIDKTIEYTFKQFNAYKNLFRDIILSLRNHKNDDIEGYKKSITAIFYIIHEDNTWQSHHMNIMNFSDLISQFVGRKYETGFKNYFETDLKTGKSNLSDKELLIRLLKIDRTNLENSIRKGKLPEEFNPTLDDLEILRNQSEIQFIYHKGMDDELILDFFTLWDEVISDNQDEQNLLAFIGIDVPLPDYDAPGDEHEKTTDYLEAIQIGLLEMKKFLKETILDLFDQQKREAYEAEVKALRKEFLA